MFVLVNVAVALEVDGRNTGIHSGIGTCPSGGGSGGFGAGPAVTTSCDTVTSTVPVPPVIG
jgi:hypothetical protein